MRRLYRALLIAAAGSLPMAAEAQAEKLGPLELQVLLAGKTIHLSAPFGSLPIRYATGGTMMARSAAMGVFAGVSEDRGSWRIAGAQFCQRWQVWYMGKEQCFSVVRDGSMLRWTSNDGMSGTASPAK
jgi:hypothetical protein